MSDEHGLAPPDDRLHIFAQEFALLSWGDQDLVMALIARLRESVAPATEYPPDVAFMDFDE